MNTVSLCKSPQTGLSLHLMHGLTLLELMITIAIAAILLTAVGPNIQSILVANQITSTVNNTSSIMRFARNRAINEQTEVTICPSANFSTCNANWALPKIVFIDTDNNGQISGSETLLASSDALPNTLRISGISNALIFQNDGSTRDARSLVFCHTNNDVRSARAILLTQFGRVTISVDSNGDGITEDISGSPLSCS